MMAEATTTPGTRYRALDAWRGIVCLVVVLEHAGVALWPGVGSEGSEGSIRRAIVAALTLNLGAPLFFVISGFCIASSLASSRRKGVTPGRFLARRLWRIFPPYWASMLAIGLLVVVLDRLGLGKLHQGSIGLELFAPSSLAAGQWFGNFTLTETWRPLIFGERSPLLLNRVAWALCYQEQFYFVCFLALVIAPRRLFGALGAATLAILAFRVVAWDSGRLWEFAGLFPDLWHEFAVGLALYWRINVAESRWSKRAVEAGFLALFAIGIWFGMVSTAAAAAFGLILLGFYRWDDAIARIGRLDLLRACGRRSYSIYLIHLPVCTVGNALLGQAGLSGFWSRALVMIPAVTAASVGAGWLFYRWVDRRFTDLPNLGVFARVERSPSPVASASRALSWDPLAESKLIRRVLTGFLAVASLGTTDHPASAAALASRSVPMPGQGEAASTPGPLNA